MCLLKLFQKIGPAKLVLPHPEEPVNPAQTSTNVSVNGVLLKWFFEWGAPPDYWEFWKSKIQINVYDNWPSDILDEWNTIKADTPAFTVEINGVRELDVLAKWLNPGVIAHEQAHTSWSLLSDSEKNEYGAISGLLMGSDPMIVLLFDTNKYGLISVIERHAEIYRYIGDKMPDELKKYYPKLLT